MRNNLLQEFIQKLFSMILLTGVITGAFPFQARANSGLTLFNLAQANPFDLPDDSRNKPAIDVQIPNCPDANGVLRGTGKMITVESTTEFEITGYVTDAAELSHFDMTGTTTETLSGGGRAKQIAVSVTGNKINAGDKLQSDQIGKIKFSAATQADKQMAEILQTSAQTAIKEIFPKAAAKLRVARDEWRGGACVEVRLRAAKTKLMPGEKINVTAKSFQKQKNAAINASLIIKSATANATPDNLRGTPEAVFTLTAPPRGATASITVESVSKRGIGTGKLEFLQDAATSQNPQTLPGNTKPPIIEPKKPVKKPVKKSAKCVYGGWKGTISVATSGKRDDPKRQTGAGGGRLQDAIAYRETNYKIDYRLEGVRDTSGKFVNAYFADVNVSYLTKHYRSFVYAPAYCGTTRIEKEKQEFLDKSEAHGNGRVTIFISAYEKNSSFQLFAPPAFGESIKEQVFFSNCPKQDGINTFIRPYKTFEWQFKGLLVEFEDQSLLPGILNGSKKIQNGDGTETTVMWNLEGECQ